jgi:hypothetical protein
MDLAGLSRDFDPALVRHIYDLHVLRNHVDRGTVITLARDIAQADAEEFRNQYPAYHADIAGETRKALDALRTDPVHRKRYDDFVSAMVYGEMPEFGTVSRDNQDGNARQSGWESRCGAGAVGRAKPDRRGQPRNDWPEAPLGDRIVW